jgi:hypothetical protein
MTHTPLTNRQQEQQHNRNGAGQYARRTPWTVQPAIGLLHRAEALASTDARGAWLDSMYSQIDAHCQPEYEYPLDETDSTCDLMPGDRFRVQLDEPHTFYIRKVYFTTQAAKRRWRIRFGIKGAPDNGLGKEATLAITVAQFRALKPVPLCVISDTDCPWEIYIGTGNGIHH